MSAERLDRYSQLARNFAVDALTAEVATAFGCEGIAVLVLKGPVLARWLYRGEVRPYVDCDLMVAPGDRARAVCVLERLGFAEHMPWMPMLISRDSGGTTFLRLDSGVVDLHCRLSGLDGDLDAIWSCFAASAERQVIGGVELRVPDRDTVLLHVVLHAAHHANQDGKPLEDLRRAIARVEKSRWSGVLEFARAYGGVAAFAAGLRLLPEGRDLACRLGLDEARSLKHEIRREDNVIAEDLYALLSADVGIRRKLAIATSRIFPRPDYMRWCSPLARRGTVGLAGAYLWRPIWIIGQAPGAIHTLWRIQRAKGRA